MSEARAGLAVVVVDGSCSHLFLPDAFHLILIWCPDTGKLELESSEDFRFEISCSSQTVVLKGKVVSLIPGELRTWHSVPNT